jgi:cell wall-associated NlpC family hydrolase
MIFKKLFPYVLFACLAAGPLALTALAQTEDLRPRKAVVVTDPNGLSRLETEPELPAFAAAEKVQPKAHPLNFTGRPSGALRFDQLLSEAIDERLGARYVYGASGPYVFDCSGFVWSAFQEIGINFERASARALWSRFTPAREDEEFKFGTLVFFSNLRHVGIVADEHGFYHASRHHGVIYSTFNDYWLKRIDGFRRVPLPAEVAAD